MVHFNRRRNLVVVKGESFSECGVVFTIVWDGLEAALKATGWLKDEQSIEKIKLLKDGLDVFIDGPMSPSSEVLPVKNSKPKKNKAVKKNR